MSDDAGDDRGFSRRTLLTRAVVFGAGAIIPAEMLVRRAPRARQPAVAPAGQTAASASDPLETLTAAEAATLEAMTARLIPTDENGPGAREARAARYIDRALGGALADSRDTYRNGLAALDAYARTSKGMPFAQLSAADQDAVLRDVEVNRASGFAAGGSAFFNLVRTHTIQGTFSDPYYGGNAAFVGWDLIGYPGIRLAVAAEDQRMDRRPAPVRRSAYEHAMFAKKRPTRAHLGRKESSWPLI